MSPPDPRAARTDDDERARLFVAVELPAQVRDALVEWQAAELADRRSLRVVSPAALHVTMCFLGWRSLGDSARIADLALACAAPVTQLSLGRPAWLPPRRPRVLVVDLDDHDGALTALQDRVAGALSDAGLFERERRAFRPHVTVARLRGGTRPRRAPTPDSPPPLDFAAAALVLYRSHLSSAGARYEPLAKAALGG